MIVRHRSPINPSLNSDHSDLYTVDGRDKTETPLRSLASPPQVITDVLHPQLKIMVIMSLEFRLVRKTEVIGTQNMGPVLGCKSFSSRLLRPFTQKWRIMERKHMKGPVSSSGPFSVIATNSFTVACHPDSVWLNMTEKKKGQSNSGSTSPFTNTIVSLTPSAETNSISLPSRMKHAIKRLVPKMKPDLNSLTVVSVQLINQSNFYSTNIPSKARLSGGQPNQCSTAKSRKQFRNINRPWGVTVSMGERPGQRDGVFRYFLKVATEMAERTVSGRLFQRDRAQEWKALAPVLVLALGTDKLLSLFDLSEREGIDVASIEWR